MYFVEREPDNIAVYDSPDDLSQAIREGAVGPDARIFHRLSSQWLSIAEHPVYRQASGQTENGPLPPIGRRHWTFLPGLGTHAQPAERLPARIIERPEKRKQPSPEPATVKPRPRWWPDSLRKVIARVLSLGPIGTS
jgi:hypothetical protein